MKIVIKIGTKLVVPDKTYSIDLNYIEKVVSQLSHLYNLGIQIILVSSGAIAIGQKHINELMINKNTINRQMLSTIGQVELINTYRKFFKTQGITISQVLFTHGDLYKSIKYFNIANILNMLIENNIIPIVNQNDVIADVDEADKTMIGNNDILAALVSNMINADFLILLTDQSGLYTSDPRINNNAKLIKKISVIKNSIQKIAGESSSGIGTGGMISKIQAANIARFSGTETIILSGYNLENLLNITKNKEFLGTRFLSKTDFNISYQQRWILVAPISGKLQISNEIVNKITKTKSITIDDILQINGRFNQGSVLSIINQDNKEIAKGITKYNSYDIIKLKDEGLKDNCKIIIHHRNIILLL